MYNSYFLYLLFALLLFLGLSGFIGGGMLILKPDGTLLGMQVGWLENSPFDNYLLPGIILFILNGIFPLFTFVGLLLKPNWLWANVFNMFPNRHWAWAYSYYSGIILITWITFQQLMTPYFWLQTVMIFTGLLIVILTITPSVMKKFEKA